MSELKDLFDNLKVKDSEKSDLFLVEDIPGFANHKIGISLDGLPIFFISTQKSDSNALDVNLESIKVEFQKICELINEQGEVKSGIYSIVYLKSNSEDIIKYFINTVFYVIKQLNVNPSFIELKNELNNLVNLFRCLSNPPKKEIQGLWTELLFIEIAKDPEYMIRCWHQNKSDRYDFNDGIDKIEIKSTRKNIRRHSFSAPQLLEISNSFILIGSTFTVETGTGICANDLLDKIAEKVHSPKLLMKLNIIVAEIMGSNLERINDTYFDYNLAVNEFKLYDINSIPSLNLLEIPSEITNIKFDCDLTNVEVISKIQTDSKLINALFYWL
jgi:hypothetical protein